MIRVTIWNEFIHENRNFQGKGFMEAAYQVHPNGIHETVAGIVRELGDMVSVKTVTLHDEEQGLSQELLDNTDVLIWWAHTAHGQVLDANVTHVYERVLSGMGLIVLHSGHYSKPFTKLMGTTCSLKWVDDTYERIFNINPGHPIAQGIPENFELGKEECYGEMFDIPKPDDVVFLSWFDIGEVFRSGCTWQRGYGKIFYFQPGHETNHSFENVYMRKIIQNAVVWAKTDAVRTYLDAPKITSTLEEKRKGAQNIE